MIALRDAARDLEIDALVRPGLTLHEIRHQTLPTLPRCGGSAMRIASRLCCSRARCSGRRNGTRRIDRDHLVDAVAEDEAAVEHRDPRLRQRHELAVQIDDLTSFTSSNQRRMRIPAAAEDAGDAARSPARPADIRRSACPPASACSVPTSCPARDRREQRLARCIDALSLSASPFGSATNRSRSKPAFTVSASPFQTLRVATVCPFAYTGRYRRTGSRS